MQFAWWLCHPKPSDNIEDVNHETALMLLQIKAGTETFGTAPCGSGPKAEGVSHERKSMNIVSVVTNTNKPLMPTSPYRARKLLSSGKAKIVKHRPFTILLVNRSDGNVQEIEYKSDTGYLHVGISVCSEKREFVREQRDLLPDEREKHNDRRKYRRTRRNRKRYRKARFDNRIGKIRKKEKNKHVWLPPSLDHKVDAQVQLFLRLYQVMPIGVSI